MTPTVAPSPTETAEPKLPIGGRKPPGRSGQRAGVAALLVLVGLVGVSGYVLFQSFAGGARDAQAARLRGVQSRADGAESVQRQAQEAFTAGDFAKAEVILRDAVQRHSADQDLRLLFAQTLIGLQRSADALAQMDAAIAIGPALAAIHFDAGTIAARAADLPAAVKHYTLAQSKDAKNPRIPLFLAMVQIRTNDQTGATASLLRVTHLDPGIAEAWGTLAELMLQQNAPTVAIQNARKARELQPEQIRWRLVEAKALNRVNLPEESAALLTGVSDQASRDPRVLTTLSECFGLLKKPANAAAAWSRAADAEPSNAEFAYQAAVWWQRAGDVEAAKKRAGDAARLGHVAAGEMLRDMERP